MNKWSLLVIVLCVQSIHAGTVWVDAMSGSNDNTGATLLLAKQTISGELGAMQAAAAGDTIKVMAGSYDVGLGEVFPIDLKHNVDIVGQETLQQDWPRIGGDVVNSTVPALFRCTADTVRGNIRFVEIQKLSFEAEDSAGEDAPSALLVEVSDGKIADVTIQNCVIRRSAMNDSGHADRASVEAIVGAGTGKLTVEDCVGFEPTIVGGVRMDVGLDAGIGLNGSFQTLIVRNCSFALDAEAAAEFAVSHLVHASGEVAVSSSGDDISANAIDSREAEYPYGYSQGIQLGGDVSDGASVAFNHSLTQIADNFIAGCRSHGLYLLGRQDSLLSSADIQAWGIYRNDVRTNGGSGVCIDYGDPDYSPYLNFQFQSNMIVDNGIGFEIKNFDDFSGAVSLLGDTIAGNVGFGIKLDGTTVGDSNGPLHDVENTILWHNNNGGAQWGGTAGWDPDDNTVYFRHNDWQGYLGTADGNIDDNPSFVNWAAGNYHLAGGSPGSPCIDAGGAPQQGPGNTPTATDFEGDRRKIDGDDDDIITVDMGADEFVPEP
jgi:hypothetical protein